MMMTGGEWDVFMGPEEEMQPHRHGGAVLSCQFLTFATVTRSTINVLTKAFHSDTTKVIDCVTVKSFC
eukprot:scaffold10889_cov27-Cyclotella_meneghiniana.AAC.3